MAGRSPDGHGLKKRVFPPSLPASGTRNYSAQQTVPNGARRQTGWPAGRTDGTLGRAGRRPASASS